MTFTRTDGRKIARTGMLLSLVALMAGCDTIGREIDSVTTKRKGPDEFSVIARAPLVMPGSRSLPDPAPGAASRLEPNARLAAVEALTGRPTTTVAKTSAGISTGEQALLNSANASSASPEIRVQLQQDAAQQDDGPYEPPSLLELVGSKGEDFDREDVLDPNAESRRLQTAGIVSPINPREEAPVAPDEANDEIEFEYSPVGRRPENRLPRREPEVYGTDTPEPSE